MDESHLLPNDLAESQRLLLAAFKASVELKRNPAAVEKRAQEEAAELRRVLDETASSFEELRQERRRSRVQSVNGKS